MTFIDKLDLAILKMYLPVKILLYHDPFTGGDKVSMPIGIEKSQGFGSYDLEI